MNALIRDQYDYTGIPIEVLAAAIRSEGFEVSSTWSRARMIGECNDLIISDRMNRSTIEAEKGAW